MEDVIQSKMNVNREIYKYNSIKTLTKPLWRSFKKKELQVITPYLMFRLNHVILSIYYVYLCHELITSYYLLQRYMIKRHVDLQKHEVATLLCIYRCKF